MTRAISILFGIGLLKPAPGTWGAAVAVALAIVVHGLGGFPLLLVATVLVTAIGWWAVARELRTRPGEDPAEIVIDEVAGQWVAMLAPSAGFWIAGLDSWNFPWPGWLGAFLMFRLFDIWKPWIIGRADRRGGATGVMLDDLLAGLFAGAVVMAAAGVAHGVLL